MWLTLYSRSHANTNMVDVVHWEKNAFIPKVVCNFIDFFFKPKIVKSLNPPKYIRLQ